jgi:hypothetical protein
VELILLYDLRNTWFEWERRLRKRSADSKNMMSIFGEMEVLIRSYFLAE